MSPFSLCSATAYCRARARIPLAAYEQLLAQTTQAARSSTSAPLWHGHRTFVIDGTGISMPDTKALRAHFGSPGQQAVGCSFPIAHLLAMFDSPGYRDRDKGDILLFLASCPVVRGASLHSMRLCERLG